MKSENLLTYIVGCGKKYIGKYIIDLIGFYNLGKTVCRIYMFSNDVNLYYLYSIMNYFFSL